MSALLTTGQVAKYCGVAPRTATKWIDSGRLRGFRIPDSEHRRVTRDALVVFLRENHMPVPEELCSQNTAAA